MNNHMQCPTSPDSMLTFQRSPVALDLGSRWIPEQGILPAPGQPLPFTVPVGQWLPFLPFLRLLLP